MSIMLLLLQPRIGIPTDPQPSLAMIYPVCIRPRIIVRDIEQSQIPPLHPQPVLSPKAASGKTLALYELTTLSVHRHNYFSTASHAARTFPAGRRSRRSSPHYASRLSGYSKLRGFILMKSVSDTSRVFIHSYQLSPDGGSTHNCFLLGPISRLISPYSFYAWHYLSPPQTLSISWGRKGATVSKI